MCSDVAAAEPEQTGDSVEHTDAEPEMPEGESNDAGQETSELVEAVEPGEELVADMNDAGQGEAEVSVGIEIPLMEAGSNLLEEYKEGIGSDETLVEWRRWGIERKNGFHVGLRCTHKAD